VTNAGLNELKDIKSLQSLNVRHTAVTVAGVKKIREALPNCSIVGVEGGP
jgi:hypothetical protein